jgi:TnsA endonuclease N terminal
MPVQYASHWDCSVKGAIPSDTFGRMVHYNGLIARGVIYLFEHDARIQSYTEQPCTIHFRLGETECSYSPDFLVTWRERKPSLLVCKTEVYLHHPKYTPQWRAAQLWCARHDCDFSLISDSKRRLFR